MRSRYTAFVRADLDYILATHDPATRGSVDRGVTERWARDSEWQGLTIVQVEAGGPADDEGTVEFIARFRLDGRDRLHHERSRFRRIEGRWHFVEGRPVTSAPVRAAPRPERNAPCPCGSGKKYKRCHGASA